MAKTAESTATPKENRKEVFTKIIKQARQFLTREGYEKPDPRPMAPPIGYKKQPSMMETMRAQVVAELARRAQIEEGAETEEEANDFEIDGDPFPVSKHEQHLDAPEDPRAARAGPLSELSTAVAQGVRTAITEAERQPAEGPSGPRQTPSQTPTEAGGAAERVSQQDGPEAAPSPGRGRFFTRPRS